VVLTAGDGERIMFSEEFELKGFGRAALFKRVDCIAELIELVLGVRMSTATVGCASEEIIGLLRDLADITRGVGDGRDLVGEEAIAPNSTFPFDIFAVADCMFSSNRLERFWLAAGATRRRSGALDCLATLAL